jgi:hypothetical protein
MTAGNDIGEMVSHIGRMGLGNGDPGPTPACARQHAEKWDGDGPGGMGFRGERSSVT